MKLSWRGGSSDVQWLVDDGKHMKAPSARFQWHSCFPMTFAKQSTTQLSSWSYYPWMWGCSIPIQLRSFNGSRTTKDMSFNATNHKTITDYILPRSVSTIGS